MKAQTTAGDENPDNGSRSSDNSNNSCDESELHGVSNNCNDISVPRDVSDNNRNTETEHPSNRPDKSTVIVPIKANTACDASDSVIDSSLPPNPGTNGLSGSPILTGTLEHRTNATMQGYATTTNSIEDNMTFDASDGVMGNGLPPNPGTNQLSGLPCSTGTSEHRTNSTMQGYALTSESSLLPGISTTGSSDEIQLPDALNWQSINNEGNGTDSFFDFCSNMSMSTPNGTWGGLNNLGVGVSGGNLEYGHNMGPQWVTSKQSVSFSDGMFYGPGPDEWLARTGATTNAGNQGQYTPGYLPLHLSTDLPHNGQPTSTSGIGPAGKQGQGIAPDLPPILLSSDLHGGQPTSTRAMVEHSSPKLPIPNSEAQAPAASLPTKEPRAPGEQSSRSGWTIIPSTRLEKMNEIGSNCKENLPPVTPQRSSEWAALAKDHLLELDLGQEWKSCVKAWLVLEESLAYGAKMKASDDFNILPAS